MDNSWQFVLNLVVYLVYFDNVILTATEANLFGVLDGVDTVLLLDARLKAGGVVALGILVLVDEVEAGLVEGHGVGGGQDAHILQLGSGGIAVAVAVDAHIVHHVDIDDFAFEVVVHGGSGVGHTFEELVLVFRLDEVPQVCVVLALAVGVDVGLAVARGHADAGVLQHAAEAAHLVPLEVGQVDHTVVVLQVLSDDIVAHIGGVAHRDLDFAIGIHNVDAADGIEAVVVDDGQMVGGVHTLASVGGVAFHQLAVHVFNEIADQFGLEVVVAAGLAGADFTATRPSAFTPRAS